MKKIIYTIAVVLLIMKIFTGCSTNVQEKGGFDTISDGKQKLKKDITLHIIHWNRLPQNIIDKFEKENEGIKISFEHFPVDKFIEIIATEIAADEVPDILGAQEINYLKYIKQGIYMDLTDENFLYNYLDDAVDELKAFSENDRVYSVPTNAFSLGIWINKDLFEKNDVAVPSNIEELGKAAEQLRSKGITPFVQGGKDGWTIEQNMYSMFDVQLANEGIYDRVKTGEQKWSEAPIRDGFMKWAGLFAKKGMLTDDSMDLTYEQAYQSFELEKAAMWPMGSWATEFIKGTDGNQKELPFKLDFIPIYSTDGNGDKVIPGTYIGAMYAISATTNNSIEAKKFLEFITKPENAVEFSKGSGVIFPIKNIDFTHIAPFISAASKTTLENKLVRPFNMTMDADVEGQLSAALQNIIAGKPVDEELAQMQKVQEKVNQKRELGK